MTDPVDNTVQTVVADAKEAVTLLTAVDAPLVAKASISAKTDIGATVLAVLTTAVGHFGLGLDQDTLTIVAGLIVIAGPYAAEYALKAYARAKAAV